MSHSGDDTNCEWRHGGAFCRCYSHIKVQSTTGVTNCMAVQDGITSGLSMAARGQYCEQVQTGSKTSVLKDYVYYHIA